MSPRYNGAPTVRWCGLEVTRLWRCGNWGNVASVLIEKPPRGDFLPIVDGGYALQYSPLLEYREGRGLVLFCQMDVTARTESDPAAETLAGNILRYVDAWRPAPRRTAVYAGEPAGLAWLAACGSRSRAIQRRAAGGGSSAGGGTGRRAANSRPRPRPSARGCKAGGRVLALGLDQAEANSFLPTKVTMQLAEHIAAWFPPFSADSLLAGVAPADIHNRDPRALPLVTGGATVLWRRRAGCDGQCRLLPTSAVRSEQSDGNVARESRPGSIQPAPHLWAHFLRGEPVVGEPWRVRRNAAVGEVR